MQSSPEPGRGAVLLDANVLSRLAHIRRSDILVTSSGWSRRRPAAPASRRPGLRDDLIPTRSWSVAEMKQTRQAKALRKPVQEPTPGARPPSRPTRTGDDGRPTEPRNVPFPVARPRAEAALTDAAAYVAAIRAAFLEEAHLRARELAAEGHQCFPDDPELARYACVLAPPKVLRADLPPDPSGTLDILWLREHVDEYRGQWIALKDGQLVAHAPSVRELKEKLPSLKDLFLTGIAP